MTSLVLALVAVGMLVAVPVGLGQVPVLRRYARPWLAPAALGVLALCVPRGLLAQLLALPYCLAVVWIGLVALPAARRRPSAPAALTLLAVGFLGIAAFALVTERGGWTVFGFPPATLALTAAHFHFAGFAASLTASLVYARTRVLWPALLVPLGTVVVLAGFFAGDEVELVGAALLALGLVGLATVTLLRVVPRTRDRPARALLTVSSLTVWLTMLLALDWAAGEVWPALPHLSLAWMAATHGVLNALGFGVCGLLGWSRLHATSRRQR